MDPTTNIRQPPSANQRHTHGPYPSALHDTQTLYNNLYKIPPYLNICTERNPMSLTRFRSQSHKLIPTHNFTIENAQRVPYDHKLCPYCDQQATGNEIHILLQFSGTKYIVNDLVATLTTLLTHSHHSTWNCLTLYQQTSIMVADNHNSPQKIPPNMAPRYPPPHSHIHSSPRNTLVQHTTRPAIPLAQSPLCPP